MNEYNGETGRTYRDIYRRSKNNTNLLSNQSIVVFNEYTSSKYIHCVGDTTKEKNRKERKKDQVIFQIKRRNCRNNDVSLTDYEIIN